MLNRFLPYLDILAILSLSVVPWFASAVETLAHTTDPGAGPLPNEFGRLIVTCFTASIPILAIMHLRQVDWAIYGFKKFDWYKDVIDGIGLGVICIVSFAVITGIFYFTKTAEFATDEMPRQIFEKITYSPTNVVLIIVASASVAFAEELAIRSYLITRILELKVAPPIAIAATSLAFAGYHIYQGMTAAVSIFACGLVLGIYFQRMQRFWPLFIAHFAIDLVAMFKDLQFEGQ